MPTTTTTTLPQATAEAAVTALEPETARALLGLARDALTLRARLVDLLDAFDGLGAVLTPPGATDLHPDGAAQDQWWDLTGQTLICDALNELAALLETHGFDRPSPATTGDDEDRHQALENLISGPLGAAARTPTAPPVAGARAARGRCAG